MKIEQIKSLDIERIGADQEGGIKAGISDDSLPFLFEMVSRSLYSNPIGSLIREITSNCFDAHIEAGVDDPVTVGKVYEEGTYYITFKDVGIGLSKERIVNIYMNYFSSTKRNTNDQIGGFGLGSKSPLSYTDLFYITTVYNGMKYDLIMHKGEALPELESLYGWEVIEEDIEVTEQFTLEQLLIGVEAGKYFKREDGTFYREVKYPIGEETNERNGTLVKIPIETKDMNKFSDEITFQLAYFDNVWFTTWNNNNDYDIYEGKHFKFRSDINQSNTEAHICLGNVRYRIDWKQIDVPASRRKMPIAIKFNIGEIQVTPNREDIRYKDETKALIKERLELAFKEIQTLFQKQNPSINSLGEYLDLVEHGRPHIRFGDGRHPLYAWANSGFESTYKFGPVAHLPITMPTRYHMFFFLERIGNIDSDAKPHYYKGYGQTVDYNDLFRYKTALYPVGEKDHFYTNVKMNLEMNRSEVYLIRKKKVDYTHFCSQLGILQPKVFKNTNKTAIIREYCRIMMEIYVRERNVKHYSDYKPTDQWVVDYKRSLRENSPAYLRRIQNKIYFREVMPNSDDTKGVEIPAADLQERSKGHILVYGFKDDRKILAKIAKVVAGHRKGIYWHPYKNAKNDDCTKRTMTNGVGYHRGNNKAFRVIQIAQNIEKHLEGIPRTGYWPNFFLSNFWKEMETAYFIAEEYRKLNLDGILVRTALVKGFKEAKEELEEIIRPFINVENRSDFEALRDHFTGVYDQKMIKVWERFKNNFGYRIPLIDCIDENSVLGNYYKRDSLIQYLRERGLRVTNQCYLRPKSDI